MRWILERKIILDYDKFPYLWIGWDPLKNLANLFAGVDYSWHLLGFKASK